MGRTLRDMSKRHFEEKNPQDLGASGYEMHRRRKFKAWEPGRIEVPGSEALSMWRFHYQHGNLRAH